MKFVIKVGTIYATIEEGNPEVVDRMLRIRDPASSNDTSRLLGLWDGLVHFFEPDQNRYPSGLTHRLVKRLQARGHSVEVVYDPPIPSLPALESDCLIGRDMTGKFAYQLEAAKAGIEQGRGIWWLATNAGKCQPAYSPVAMFDGSLRTIGELAPGDLVWGMSPDSLRLVCDRVSAVAFNGIKPIYTVKLSNGGSVRCTGNHPFMTGVGQAEWTNAEDLAIGQKVAVVSSLSCEGRPEPMSEAVGLRYGASDPKHLTRSFTRLGHVGMKLALQGILRNNDLFNGVDLGCEDSARMVAHALTRYGVSSITSGGLLRVPDRESLIRLRWSVCVPTAIPEVCEELQRISNDVITATVVSISVGDPEPTFAVETSITHSYVSDGVIVHNSSVTAGMVGHLARHGYKSVVIVPNKYLVNQTSKEIQELVGPSVKVGIAGDGKLDISGSVLVGTYQTLVRGADQDGKTFSSLDLNKYLKSAACVVVDEGHHATSPAITSILKTCRSAVWRIGCTGTVDKRDHSAGANDSYNDKARLHRWRLESFLGPVIARVTNSQLIEAGVSAKPKILLIEDREAFGPRVLTPIPIPGVPFQPTVVYQNVFKAAAIRDKRFRSSIVKVAKAALEAGKTPMVFSHSVEQLKRLKVTFEKRGVPFEILTGKESTAERNRVVGRYKTDKNFVLGVSSIFDEGASINEIRTVILAGARKSPVEILQRVGRGLRKKDNDNTMYVVDFSMMHSSMLSKHYRTRCATYDEQDMDTCRVNDISRISEYFTSEALSD